MKVTIQRTSKPAKILMLLGMFGIFMGIYGLMTAKIWALVPMSLGAVLWLIGKISSWFFNE